jgi:mitogen-activated protein kinase kinase kinase
VYNRLEDFFPEHDLDMPVIEATSGTGSPTAAEYPAAPPVPDKDKPEKGLTRGKKSIRIVAEEHKKRIDRTSRPDNLANVLRKRSTKLWGSRLEEVTTEQAKAEYARALYAKPPPAPESPSGGPRRKRQRHFIVHVF